MIPEQLSACLLSLPLIVMIPLSIRYWKEYLRGRMREEESEKIAYPKPFYQLLILGVLSMWMFWIGGILFQALNLFQTIFGVLIIWSPIDFQIQLIGFLVFFAGSTIYNIVIYYGGKSIQPSMAKVSEKHQLVDSGPYAFVRHPLYLSYTLILIGLSLVLHIYWLFIPALFLVIGIYPTAKAEERILLLQIGEEYRNYQKRVGMLFPKFSKSGKKSKNIKPDNEK